MSSSQTTAEAESDEYSNHKWGERTCQDGLSAHSQGSVWKHVGERVRAAPSAVESTAQLKGTPSFPTARDAN